MLSKNPVVLNDIIEGSENCLHTQVMKAPLVAYDPLGVLRYVTEWDIHTTEVGDEEDGDGFSLVTSARLVFRFGDVANV